MLSAVKVQSSNHWIAKEFPYGRIFKTSIEDYTGLTYFEERKWLLKAEGKLQGFSRYFQTLQEENVRIVEFKQCISIPVYVNESANNK